ncbi:hypothetical protein RJG79_08330 [Mycoplasmatota bacterium WC44]
MKKRVALYVSPYTISGKLMSYFEQLLLLTIYIELVGFELVEVYKENSGGLKQLVLDIDKHKIDYIVCLSYQHLAGSIENENRIYEEYLEVLNCHNVEIIFAKNIIEGFLSKYDKCEKFEGDKFFGLLQIPVFSEELREETNRWLSQGMVVVSREELIKQVGDIPPINDEDDSSIDYLEQ